MKETYIIPLIDDAVPACIFTPRRVPHPLLPKVKSQLNKMEKMKVISKVTEPTKWCAGMAQVPVFRRSMHMCGLNSSEQGWQECVVCSVNENLATIKDSKIFTKLDPNSGF